MHLRVPLLYLIAILLLAPTESRRAQANETPQIPPYGLICERLLLEITAQRANDLNTSYSPGELVRVNISDARQRMGVYLGMTPNGAFRVRLNSGVTELDRHRISPFILGTIDRARDAYGLLKRMITPKFEPQETVRFRGPDGRMLLGEFRMYEQHRSWVRVDDMFYDLPSINIFKVLPGTVPSTRVYPSSRYYETTRELSDTIKVYLDGVARVSSHPTFLRADMFTRLLMLAHFTNTMIPWDGSALPGGTSLEQTICAGAGVCRHQAVLLGMGLAELGISADLVFTIGGPGKPGHAWILVEGLDQKFYVVDPSTSEVRSLERLEQIAATNPADPSVLLYLNEARIHVKTIPWMPSL